MNCAISSNCIHVGDIGSGHTLKSINNLLNVSNLLILTEGLKCLYKYGINIEDALNVIQNSSGRSIMSEQRYPISIIQNDYNYGFELGLMKKDVDIALNLLNKTMKMN